MMIMHLVESPGEPPSFSGLEFRALFLARPHQWGFDLQRASVDQELYDYPKQRCECLQVSDLAGDQQQGSTRIARVLAHFCSEHIPDGHFCR